MFFRFLWNGIKPLKKLYMKNNIKHIFFDLDNTLWDTDKNSKLTLKNIYENLKIEEKYQLQFSDFYISYYNRNENLWSLYRQDKVSKADILEKRFRDTFLEFHINDPAIWDYFNANFLTQIMENNNLIEYAEEILKYLKTKGYQLHVVSNGFVIQTEQKVQETCIKDYITSLTSGEEINKRKPAKEVFELGLKKAHALVNESAFIGDDWEADVLGSQRIGMYPVYFNYKKEDHYKNAEIPIIKNLLELKNIF
ncbi:HAD hydrolase-like protein [Apibacter sp. B3924]|nr:HAD hydrolase-like protein [Apibacter sp. B3924]MXO26868.1 HAD hydrolase-like protein [Apibacter sp. B3813]MXO28562.1 HAD hydrolase-like protein [Apibacter sp. B3913]MXO30516.1 HAD hydrolase-like protein [Apibacter sp. B3912]MXP02030.1 HAD hydrolase-like protein [Apibacter sp. B3918]